MLNNMKIVFMGTPDFAAYSLQYLIESNFQIVAVVTAPDKPAGRGLSVQMSSVKRLALKYTIPILQPTNLKDVSFLDSLRKYKADLQVVVAFRMLPNLVWEMPPLGTINLHASLLPQYRGAAPINWAIINGETLTGVTTFYLNNAIDTGKIIKQAAITISENETAGMLHDKLMVRGAELLKETIEAILIGNITGIDQQSLISTDIILKLAPKITKDMCVINWQRPATEIVNFIRGLSPYPGAYTFLNFDGSQKILFKISLAESEIAQHSIRIGNVISDNKSFIKVAVIDGFIKLVEVQIAGRKKMNVEDFLRGTIVNSTWKII